MILLLRSLLCLGDWQGVDSVREYKNMRHGNYGINGNQALLADRYCIIRDGCRISLNRCMLVSPALSESAWLAFVVF